MIRKKEIEKRQDIKINQPRTTDGATPLYITVQNGHLDAVKILLAQKDINVNQVKLKWNPKIRVFQIFFKFNQILIKFNKNLIKFYQFNQNLIKLFSNA